MRKKLMLLVLLPIVLLLGCTKKFDNKIEVIRIFMHEPTRYSFIIRDNSSRELKIKTVDMNGRREGIKIYADVATTENMWIRHYGQNEFLSPIEFLEIHIHGVYEIEGGGWNHGKFGRGTTTVIE